MKNTSSMASPIDVLLANATNGIVATGAFFNANTDFALHTPVVIDNGAERPLGLRVRCVASNRLFTIEPISRFAVGIMEVGDVPPVKHLMDFNKNSEKAMWAAVNPKYAMERAEFHHRALIKAINQLDDSQTEFNDPKVNVLVKYDKFGAKVNANTEGPFSVHRVEDISVTDSVRYNELPILMQLLWGNFESAIMHDTQKGNILKTKQVAGDMPENVVVDTIYQQNGVLYNSHMVLLVSAEPDSLAMQLQKQYVALTID